MNRNHIGEDQQPDRSGQHSAVEDIKRPRASMLYRIVNAANGTISPTAITPPGYGISRSGPISRAAGGAGSFGQGGRQSKPATAAQRSRSAAMLLEQSF